MGDSVDILDVSRNSGAIESAIEGWVTDNGEFDRTYCVKRGENKIMVVIEYTAA